MNIFPEFYIFISKCKRLIVIEGAINLDLPKHATKIFVFKDLLEGFNMTNITATLKT